MPFIIFLMILSLSQNVNSKEESNSDFGYIKKNSENIKNFISNSSKKNLIKNDKISNVIINNKKDIFHNKDSIFIGDKNAKIYLVVFLDRSF